MATYKGTSNHDVFTGTSGNDAFTNIAGGDTVDGGAGDDTISIDLGYTDIAVNYNAIAAATSAGTEPLWYMSVKNVEHLGTLVTGGGDDSLTISAAQGAFVWHAGAGTDTLKLDFSAATAGMSTNITAAGFTTGTAGSSTAIGLATGIERVEITGSKYNDSLWGTAGNDILLSGAGDDSLSPGSGKDVVDGGAGFDRLLNGVYGDATVDVTYDAVTAATSTGITLFNGTVIRNVEGLGGLTTGSGNDTLMVSAAQKDFAWIANGGTDILVADYSASAAGITVTFIANTPVGPDLRIHSVEMPTNLNGDAYMIEGVNLTGSRFADSIQGTDGRDTINGGAGGDSMAGGKGDDTYYVDEASDVVSEAAGAGNDTVISSTASYTLTDNVENLVLGMVRGPAPAVVALNGTGNALNNTLTGNNFDNVLDGKGGADIMTGGLGNDTYYVDNAGDVVSELAGQGTDTVISALASYALGGNVENLTLSGTGNSRASGNALDNVLTGNSGANELNGNDGNDVLDGKGGADTMNGGKGNDTFYVDNAHDIIGEYWNEGIDAVISSVTFSLANTNADNLTLSGTANLNATGNGLVNILIGNGGSNVLDGGAGNDTLTGGAGADRFVFGAGSGRDTVTDFRASQDDRIDVHAYAGTQHTISQHGADTWIDFGGGNVVVIQNVTATDSAFLSHIVW